MLFWVPGLSDRTVNVHRGAMVEVLMCNNILCRSITNDDFHSKSDMRYE